MSVSFAFSCFSSVVPTYRAPVIRKIKHTAPLGGISKLAFWTTGRESVTAERRLYGKIISTRPFQRHHFRCVCPLRQILGQNRFRNSSPGGGALSQVFYTAHPVHYTQCPCCLAILYQNIVSDTRCMRERRKFYGSAVLANYGTEQHFVRS